MARRKSIIAAFVGFARKRTREVSRPPKPIRVPDFSRPGRFVVKSAVAVGKSRRYISEGGTKSIYGKRRELYGEFDETF